MFRWSSTEQWHPVARIVYVPPKILSGFILNSPKNAVTYTILHKQELTFSIEYKFRIIQF